MTVEADVLALTSKITALNSRVTGRKDKLAAAVDTATDAVTLSATAEAQTLANRDELEDLQTAAYGYSLAAATATPVSDLTAIAQSKAVTAVDVFVYDTSKDSDGGAWRKRCQHTSWYRETLNTATRGSRREFPAVAVIVAESDKVTIYDGDDPTLPMWWSVSGTSANSGKSFFYLNTLDDGSGASLSAFNGQIALGISYGNTNGGVRIIDFVADRAKRLVATSLAHYGGYIAPITALQSTPVDGTYLGRLVNDTVNDVAMTVLPNAPVDPATGLPIPTIAVATDGGVSVIKDDGTIVDLTCTLSGYGLSSNVAFGDGGSLWLNFGSNIADKRRIYRLDEIPASDFVVATSVNIKGNADGYYSFIGANTSLYPAEGYFLADASSADGEFIFGKASGFRLGLTLFDENKTTASKGMVSYITSSYNTGWMPGDIKLATLSDTTPGTIAGQDELVVNGTFDTGVDGWVILQGTAQVVDGEVEITTGSVDRGRIYQVFDTEIGKTYEFSGTARDGTTGTFAHVSGTGVSYLNNILYNVGSTSTTESYRFTARTNTVTVQLGALSTEAGYTAYFDNVSVKEVVADRSVNNTALQAYGNIVKSPVADGADLMAYRGFSTSLGNYLEQPYNSDLDFGTGDFCEMIWAYRTTAALRYFSSWGSDASGDRRSIYVNSDNSVYWNLNEIGVSSVTLSGGTMKLNAWSHIVGVRKNGVAYIYVDGRLKASSAAALNLENTNAVQRLGISYAYTSALTDGKIALYKISATAPSAEQIKKIYEDEKVLFQEGAKATLYGSSDAVTALAYDDTTDLLHVGTSAGRSVFDGLRRIEHTTTAVGTAISASGGLVVEE